MKVMNGFLNIYCFTKTLLNLLSNRKGLYFLYINIINDQTIFLIVRKFLLFAIASFITFNA